MKKIQLIGKRFGLLVVVSQAENQPKHNHARWKCICDCGNTTIVLGASLRGGNTKSCGCFRGEKHGEANHSGKAGSKEYRAWKHIKERCSNPRTKQFEYWGGRGISMYPEWVNSYKSFLEYIGRAPTKNHSIDRYPNKDGNYEPGNIRWATAYEQNTNLRKRKDSKS